MDNQQPSTPTQPPTEPTEPQQAVVGSAKSGPPKWLVLLLAVVLVAAAGFAAWWFFLKEDSTPTAQNDSQTQEAADNQTPGIPRNFVFAKSSTPAQATKDNLHWLKIGETEAQNPSGIGEELLLSGHGVFKDKVFVFNSTDNGEEVWYSADDGKSYKQIFKTTGGSGEGSLGDQITSGVFASDGSSLLIAVYTADEKYVVKEINLVSEQAADVFTADKPLILSGYDAAADKVYYLKANCWNCDGGLVDNIFAYDLTAKAEATLAKPTAHVESFTLNQDYTKALVVTGTPGDGLGLGAPFNLHELDVKTNQLTAVVENSETFLKGGYSIDNEAFYFTGNKMFMAGSQTPMFESSRSISDVLFVNADAVIATTSDDTNTNLVSYQVASASFNTLMEDGTFSNAIGITHL